MATRNTQLLSEVVEALAPLLADKQTALAQLEDHFRDSYVVNAGDIEHIATQATQLRLNVTRDECSAVLDHIASTGMVSITIDQVETAVYELLGNRFIEPEE